MPKRSQTSTDFLDISEKKSTEKNVRILAVIGTALALLFIITICYKNFTEDSANVVVDEPLKVDPVADDDADEDVLASNMNTNRCRKRYFSSGRWSFVCVCDANSCDEPEPLGEHSDDEFLVYRSTPEAWRLRREKKKFWKWKSMEETSSGKKDGILSESIELLINSSNKRQKILGFGASFTDSVGEILNALSNGTRQRLLEAYFANHGIKYNLARVPLASCDFSPREYSYLEKKDDFNLETFELADEDFQYKIPHILEGLRLSDGRLKLYGSPWSAPAWMKTSERMAGPGELKGEFNGKYYQTYARYFVRFLEEYAKKGIHFYAVTIQNEAFTSGIDWWPWQTMHWTPKMQRDFAFHLLKPAIEQSELVGEGGVKIIAHDDIQNNTLTSAQQIYDGSEAASAVDGLAFHWYVQSNYSDLSKVHNLQPDRLILASEACSGFHFDEEHIQVGNWQRGMDYALDIIRDLQHWTNGWTDWNMVLDMHGGPNWVNNFVDAPVLVNASADEFYKQPMFYAMAHFSTFVPRDSVVIHSKINADNYQPPLDDTKEEEYDEKFPIQHIAFQTPPTADRKSESTVVVMVNTDPRKSYNVTVRDVSDLAVNRRASVAVEPLAMVTVVWRNAKRMAIKW